jgi:type IV pilus assembly protein PilY1
MNVMSFKSVKFALLVLLSAICLDFQVPIVYSAAMGDYCVRPPFITQTVPPMVMFEMGRDHKLYYEAYNDGVDLNGDGRIETTYDHSISYYGYFNPNKCYQHTGSSGNNDYFYPVATATNRFCSSGQWSGNILNWLTMSRMDVLKKVMYGGERSEESPRVLLNRVYIPQDAHSWGKEYTGRLCSNGTNYKQMCVSNADCTDAGYTCQDKSVNLIGSSAPTGGTPCSAAGITWGTGSGYEKMLVVRYENSTPLYGNDHDDMISAFDYTQFKSGFSPTYVSDFNDSILDPGTAHQDNYATMVVAEFLVANNKGGAWQFAIDGDDGVELEVRNIANGNIVQTTSGNNQISYYGAHGQCSSQTHSGTINLAENTWYRMIVRHAEASGQDGVKVWFKRPGDSDWTVFGQRGSTPKLDVRAPNITIGTNDCTLRSQNFINTGVPTATTETTAPKRHLFCNTTLSDGVPTSSSRAKTLLRMITNSSHRIWEWASKERPVCDDTFDDGSSAATNRTDYTMQVEVCKSGVGTLSEEDRFERCRNYGGTYKPIGLFQKYGEYVEDGTGVSKVCSKTLSKACNNDNDCGAGEGLCFDKSRMYFGYMTTSYTKNTSGGVLRKNPGPVSDEVNLNDGSQKTAENTRGNLIISMDRLHTIDFDYGTHSYSNCGWITDRPINEGECKMWGNPIAEMMYESLRYFAGKGEPTAEFTYSTPADSGISLTKPTWGYNKGSTWYQPFDIYPSCSQPFLLLLSDVNTSYDSDQIPGSSYSSFTEDANSPQLELGSTQASGKSLLNDLLDTIGSVEGVNNNSWFVGESNGTTDFICSAKNASNLHSLRGTCPEEPTKRGSYYAAALAYYGKSQFAGKTGKSPVSTFAVALSSPFADIKVKAGNNFVSVVPVAKSVSGCGVDKCLGYGSCTYSTDASGRISLNNCPTDAFCPTNSLVDFYIDDMRYDTSNNIIYAKFRINFEDVEQGADHDMDAIATYELCTQAAADNNYGSCGGTIAGLQVKVNSDYASGCLDQVIGFVISGTTEDGTYLVVKDKDVGSGSLISSLPLSWNKTFATSSTPGAGYLKNPLWYAAKWGGYTGTGLPDTPSKWDRDNNGIPDSYFPVSNPLQLDEQLDLALNAILARVASGTAASILNNSEGSGANLLQAVFYPKKTFHDNTEATWIGEMQNLWYYLDPFLQNTSIREDTTNTSSYPELNLNGDKIVKFYFNASENKTLVQKFSDADGDGSPDNEYPDTTVEPDDVLSLWKAGQLLHARDLSTSPRTIYTYTTGSGFTAFDTTSTNVDKIKPYLDVSNDSTKAVKVIKYIIGYDDLDDTSLRSRTVSYKGVGGNLSDATVRSNANTKGIGVWKLGDIISSTPKLLSNVRLNTYHLTPPTGYNDSTYSDFINTSTYRNRGMVFVGANDGMLHAFNLGILTELNDKFKKAKIEGFNQGEEMWSFIPKNALPYLKYLSSASPEYCHLYYVDSTSTLADVSINKSNLCSASNYWECEKKYTQNDGTTDLSWRTVLIGGMGLGGASKNTTDSQCVKTPIQVSEAGVTQDIGYSSYFALDVTDPAYPIFKWEFAGDPANGDYLGYTTSGPAIVRVGDKSKNGRWLAVFASGPTGPIDTTAKEFRGTSNQNLKLFIVDIATGALVRKINITEIPNAFGGSLNSAVIDTDRWNPNSTGFYNDDAIYIGYVQKNDVTGQWTKGGVIRLLTQENTDPDTWTWSKVIEDIGPVTSAITKLQDRRNKNLWLYFGTGRYFFRSDDSSSTSQQTLYGIKEPCYSENTGSPTFTPTGPVNDIKNSCTTTISSGLTDQTGTSAAPATSLSADSKGWYINLDQASGGYASERVITDPIASPNGAVFFTTFMPTGDICGFGGNSYIWSVRYDTGAEPPEAALKGVALMQVSTGSFAEIRLADAFTTKNMRRTGNAIQGVPPKAQGMSLLTNPRPVKKIIHIQEK